MRIAAFILTKNEAIHIERCIKSIKPHVNEVYIIDSGSNDKTLEIASALGAKILKREWCGYSAQINWTISKIGLDYDWLFRLDADEIYDEAMPVCSVIDTDQINKKINGCLVNRNIVFMGKKLRFGTMKNRKTLRLFRPENASCDNRLMDEKIIVSGIPVTVDISITDHCLKGINFWLYKHIKYAELEVEELSRVLHRFSDNRVKSTYYSSPVLFRCFLYFSYRYFFRLGFLDGKAGFVYAFLQAFWYRVIVDQQLITRQTININRC